MIVSLVHRVPRRGGDTLESVGRAMNVAFARFAAMGDSRVSRVRILKDVSPSSRVNGDKA